jgi:hypothetical protein
MVDTSCAVIFMLLNSDLETIGFHLIYLWVVTIKKLNCPNSDTGLMNMVQQHGPDTKIIMKHMLLPPITRLQCQNIHIIVSFQCPRSVRRPTPLSSRRLMSYYFTKHINVTKHMMDNQHMSTYICTCVDNCSRNNRYHDLHVALLREGTDSVARDCEMMWLSG